MLREHCGPRSLPALTPWNLMRFAIFDPRRVFSQAEELFPGRGPAVSEVWRVRQFEYAWLRAVSQTVQILAVTNEKASIALANAFGIRFEAAIRRSRQSRIGQVTPHFALSGYAAHLRE